MGKTGEAQPLESEHKTVWLEMPRFSGGDPWTSPRPYGRKVGTSPDTEHSGAALPRSGPRHAPESSCSGRVAHSTHLRARPETALTRFFAP